MSVRSQIYAWESNAGPDDNGVATFTVSTNGSGYVLQQGANVSTSYNNTLSQISTTGAGSGFQVTIPVVSQVDTEGLNAIYNVGNFVINSGTDSGASVSDVYVWTDGTETITATVDTIDGSGTPTSFTISDDSKILASRNDTIIVLTCAGTGKEAELAILNTNGAGGPDFDDSNYNLGGQLDSLTLLKRGSGYGIGDTITLTAGQGGAYSDDNSTISKTSAVVTVASLQSSSETLPLGMPFSLFTGGYGNNIKNPPKTTPTQFIVVEQYGATPTYFTDVTKGVSDGDTYRGQTAFNNMAGPRAYIQFYVNTTGYFKDPDGVARQGIPANNFPYPETAYSRFTSKKEIPVYILPGQTWDARLTLFNGTANIYQATTLRQVRAFLKYTLYDGPDALIAMRLLENGIPIRPQNVDEYRKRLINSHNS